jgi:hypothetical protein
MQTMLRKLNFTERGKIARTNVRVTLRRDDDGTLVFDPHVSFEGVDAAASCRVFVEAWYRTSFMRFDCGSVEAFAPPRDRRLTEIDGTSLVHFRVKIVDNRANDHRVVAVADDIVVSAEKEQTAGRLPLLPVNFSDALGQQAWRVTFESNGPVLELIPPSPASKTWPRTTRPFWRWSIPPPCGRSSRRSSWSTSRTQARRGTNGRTSGCGGPPDL